MVRVGLLSVADGADFVAGVVASRDLHQPWLDPPDDLDRFAAYLDGSGPDTHLTFGVWCQACSCLCGWVRVANIVRRAFLSAAVSYGVFAGHDGQGLMTSGLRAVLEVVFAPASPAGGLGLHRLEANIQPGNTASLALVRRLGFSQEGFSPAFLEVDGAWRDHERWALRAEQFAGGAEERWAPPLPVRTERLLLRAFRPDDIDAVLALYSQPETLRYLYLDAMDRVTATRSTARKASQSVLRRSGDRLSLAVEDRAGSVVGDVSLRWTSDVDRQGEVGYVINPAHQGRGYATEASRAVLDLGFTDLDAGGLGLHRIEGRCDARNAASAAVLRRVGMRQEAHLVGHQRFKDEWDDELVFAILEDAWRLRCGAST